MEEQSRFWDYTEFLDIVAAKNFTVQSTTITKQKGTEKSLKGRIDQQKGNCAE